VFVALARVAVGIHYPSDNLVGALIGIAVTLALNRGIVRRRIAQPILSLEARYPPCFRGYSCSGSPNWSKTFPSAVALPWQSCISSGSTLDKALSDKQVLPGIGCELTVVSPQSDLRSIQASTIHSIKTRGNPSRIRDQPPAAKCHVSLLQKTPRSANSLSRSGWISCMV
jgi:hypothetical protein